ncbi:MULTISPECIES: type II toxin-antitoxin system RelB/DinJ family antitoxin [Cysteiniphilum]|uniref:type II toxin-antitoxin system RelB/DinJ family antitoxin n=1 Tax=Cysteiniphilum TaxID=2056696 RepID=UPI00177BAC00|nr:MULTISPECIES: type II toxin-antitoxin system RelB/DinJ family antitoxin [Cysteiniphilum]
MSSTRINITLDDDLKNQATALAKDMGLSFSALVRLLLAKTVKNKLSGVEQGLLDYINGDVVKMTSEEFFNELERDIQNARN